MRNTSKINEKLNQVWKGEPIYEEPKEEEKPKVVLPPQHILEYRFKEKPKGNKWITYAEAQTILGFKNYHSVSMSITKGKFIGKDGLVDKESVLRYKETRLPSGLQGSIIKKGLKIQNKKDNELTYEEAHQMLGISKGNFYNLVWKGDIIGKDGICLKESVEAYKKAKEEAGERRGRKARIKNPVDEAIDSFFEGVKPLVLDDPIECLPPEKIVVPTLEDVEKALNENIVGDSYKHLKIDTVEWSKANHSKEQQKAICQFMINKYTMRQKNQDKDDIKKARFYLDWLEETI